MYIKSFDISPQDSNRYRAHAASRLYLFRYMRMRIWRGDGGMSKSSLPLWGRFNQKSDGRHRSSHIHRSCIWEGHVAATGSGPSAPHPPQQHQGHDGHGQVQRQVAVVAGIHPVADGEGDLPADDLRALGVGHHAAEPAAVPLLFDVLPTQGGFGEALQVDPLSGLRVEDLPLVGVGLDAAGDLHLEAHVLAAWTVTSSGCLVKRSGSPPPPG